MCYEAPQKYKAIYQNIKQTTYKCFIKFIISSLKIPGMFMYTAHIKATFWKAWNEPMLELLNHVS